MSGSQIIKSNISIRFKDDSRQMVEAILGALNSASISYSYSEYKDSHISSNSLHDKLKSKLGNFEDYENMGFYIDTLNTKKNHYMRAMEKYDPNIKWPDFTNECECGRRIQQQCYIRHKMTKVIYVIGNCCIKKFNVKKNCVDCGALHDRTKSVQCKTCFETSGAKKQYIKEYQSKIVKCECGTLIQYASLNIHKKSKKHEKYLKFISQVEGTLK